MTSPFLTIKLCFENLNKRKEYGGRESGRERINKTHRPSWLLDI